LFFPGSCGPSFAFGFSLVIGRQVVSNVIDSLTAFL